MAKQGELIEGRGIPELDDAAEALQKVRTKRIKLLAQEIEQADVLLDLMKKNKKTVYTYDGHEVTVVPGKEKVKVRSQKEEPEEEE